MKKKGKTLTMCILLSVLVALSFVYLFSIFEEYVIEERHPVINLVEDTTAIEVNKKDTDDVWVVDVFNGEDENHVSAGGTIIKQQSIKKEPTGNEFITEDENVIWETDTAIELFKLKDDELNIVSADGSKVIAPGSENTYIFNVRNNGAESIRYTVEFLAYFNNEEARIPVEVKLLKDNSYLLGEEEYEEIEKLNGFNDQGTLPLNYSSSYELSWMWPFEKDDVYDTYLGNLAVEEDVTLTVEIKTTAEVEMGETTVNRPVNTGDNTNIKLYVVVFIVSFVLFLVLMLRKRGKDEIS